MLEPKVSIDCNYLLEKLVFVSQHFSPKFVDRE